MTWMGRETPGEPAAGRPVRAAGGHGGVGAQGCLSDGIGGRAATAPAAAGFMLSAALDVRLLRVLERVCRHPSIEYGLAELASDSGASVRTLNRLFSQQLGCSFRQWRQQVVMGRARQLQQQGQPLSRIALELGYGISALFSRFQSLLAGTGGAVRREPDPGRLAPRQQTGQLIGVAQAFALKGEQGAHLALDPGAIVTPGPHPMQECTRFPSASSETKRISQRARLWRRASRCCSKAARSSRWSSTSWT